MPLEFLPARHPINRINPDVLELLVQAQGNTFGRAFPKALMIIEGLMGGFHKRVLIHPQQ
jgi:hypothetical protein